MPAKPVPVNLAVICDSCGWTNYPRVEPIIGNAGRKGGLEGCQSARGAARGLRRVNPRRNPKRPAVVGTARPTGL